MSKGPGKGPGLISRNLDKGAAARRHAEQVKKTQKARTKEARRVLEEHDADTFDAKAHAERVSKTVGKILNEAVATVMLRQEQVIRERTAKRYGIYPPNIGLPDHWPGRGALEKVANDRVLRSAIAAELDAIERGETRVIPEGNSP